VTLSLRRLRLRAVWLLVVPFLWLARPTAASLAVGGLLALLGAALRGWAAGTIRKERELSTGGPYAHTRNPLYLGSFLIGAGVTVAGGRWEFALLFLVFFAGVYGRAIRAEARLLGERFGERYADYARSVPLFVPRVVPYRSSLGAAPGGFTLARWRRNREYEALLGVIAGFAFLAAKLFWG
jgi:protein-S-isoprenylcysteine O-methyltransferase Ste14